MTPVRSSINEKSKTAKERKSLLSHLTLPNHQFSKQTGILPQTIPVLAKT